MAYCTWFVHKDHLAGSSFIDLIDVNINRYRLLSMLLCVMIFPWAEALP